METLTAFLKENKIKREEVEYVASKDFHDADGEPVAWRLRCLSNEEMDALRDRYTKRIKNKATRQTEEKFDHIGFTMAMTLASVVFPDLKDATLQDSYEVADEEDLLKAMLSPGELADLQMAVNEANDFEVGMDEKIKKAKN
nr:MAG TPA_asm: tail assembly chaperone protein [Caudoviricetes sp.]